MASSRNPKGVYVRNTPDWFSQNLCVIGDYDGVALDADTVTTWSLLNNDQQGRYMYIHAVNGYGDNALAFLLSWPASAGGSIVQTGQFVRLDQGGAPGALYRRIDTPPMGSTFNSFVPNPQMAITDFNGSMIQLGGAAMWIIPTGSFLVAGSSPAGGNNFFTCWYSFEPGQ